MVLFRENVVDNFAIQIYPDVATDTGCWMLDKILNN